MIWKPHATVASIIERNNQFLLVEEKVNGLIVYNQPAGHLEPGESFLDAVIRETDEETAWKFQPEYITGIYLWQQPNHNDEQDRTYLRVAFCGKCLDHQADQILDEGIIRAVWMTRDEVIDKTSQLRSPMVLRCIDDYLSNKRFSLDTLTTL